MGGIKYARVSVTRVFIKTQDDEVIVGWHRYLSILLHNDKKRHIKTNYVPYVSKINFNQ